MNKRLSTFIRRLTDQILISQGFTLIEMLVTIAIIAIVSGAIIVGIAPQKRIQDSQDSKAKQDVRAVASAVEACLSYADSTGATNVTTDCDTGPELVSTSGTPKGGPFARAVSTVTFLTTAGNPLTICFYEQGSTSPVNYWYYKTSTGSVTSSNTIPTCP